MEPTDAAEREQRTSLLVLCQAARRKRRECGLKPRGDKFSGSQLAVGKMVAFALLRVKRSPFLNPPPTLRPSSENSSAAFLLSPTEYFLSRHPPTCGARRWGSSTKFNAIRSSYTGGLPSPPSVSGNDVFLFNNYLRKCGMTC